MLLSKPLENLGDIKGVVCDFEFVGDKLPFHIHTKNDVHITIVTNGKIKVYGTNWEIEAKTGQIVDFQPNQKHEIVALENNTRVINIIKYYSMHNILEGS